MTGTRTTTASRTRTAEVASSRRHHILVRPPTPHPTPHPPQGDGVTKPPSKSWYRPRNIILGITAAIAVAWVTSIARWRATAVPAPVVDYAAKLVELSESYQPEGEDAWPLLLEAAVIFHEVATAIAEMEFEPRDGEAGFYLDFYRAYDPQLTDLEPERLALEMLREQGAFDRLAQAAARPRALRPLKGATSPLFNVLLPELMDFRSLARARVAGMCLALRDGDGREAAAALEQTLALARAMGSQALLIDRLVGNSIAALAATQLRYALQEAALDEATCLALLAAMDRQLPVPPVQLALEGERLFLLDTIQWSFTDDGHGDGRLDPAKAASLSSATVGTNVGGRLQAIFLAGRAETTRIANDFFDKTVAESRLNPVTRAASPFDADDYASKLSTRHSLLTTIMPATGKVLHNDHIAHLQLEGTRVMIALEAYRARHGAYPARLEQLVGGILSELPADPTHGGSFAYRVLQADPHGRGYLLYSTGLDQTDDGGALPSATQHHHSALQDASATGIDYVINQPRPEGD